jgi:hypothetical protein
VAAFLVSFGPHREPIRALASRTCGEAPCVYPLGGRDACVAQDLLDDALAAKIRNSVVLYRPLCEVDGVEVRLHVV